MQMFSFKCHLKKEKVKNGLAPIYIRIYVDGKKVEISTGLSIDLKSWNNASGKARSSYRNADLINSYLTRSQTELEQIFLQNSASGKEVTARGIKNSFL